MPQNPYQKLLNSPSLHKCHVKPCDKQAETYHKNKGVTYFTCHTHDPIKGLVQLYAQGNHKTRQRLAR